MELPSNNVSLAGEYAVLSQLFLRGFVANVTLGNTKGVDILVFNPRTQKMFRIEVKTKKSAKNQPYSKKNFGPVEGEWQVSPRSESLSYPDLFYCFVNASNEAYSFEFYVVPSSIVSDYLLERRLYKESIGQKEEGTFRWFRLGKSGTKYPSNVPSSQEFREAWGLLI